MLPYILDTQQNAIKKVSRAEATSNISCSDVDVADRKRSRPSGDIYRDSFKPQKGQPIEIEESEASSPDSLKLPPPLPKLVTHDVVELSVVSFIIQVQCL